MIKYFLSLYLLQVLEEALLCCGNNLKTAFNKLRGESVNSGTPIPMQQRTEGGHGEEEDKSSSARPLRGTRREIIEGLIEQLPRVQTRDEARRTLGEALARYKGIL